MSVTYSLHGNLPNAIEKVYNVFPGRYEFMYPCDERDNCEPYKVTLSPGKYQIELWGANGGYVIYDGCSCKNKVVYGGLGGYTAATIKLETTKTFYLFIGAGGHDFPYEYAFDSYNGGGYSQEASGGGGGTDLLLSDQYTNSIDVLKTRILIAGGGGGSDCNGYGGAGGGLIGGNATNGGKGGTQSAGGAGGIPGDLWHGAHGNAYSSAGGGGGLYGGGFGTSKDGCGNGGGGGSSYASKDFTDVILLHGDDNNILYPIHFQKGVNGAARITIISPASQCHSNSFSFIKFSYLFIIL